MPTGYKALSRYREVHKQAQTGPCPRVVYSLTGKQKNTKITTRPSSLLWYKQEPQQGENLIPTWVGREELIHLLFLPTNIHAHVSRQHRLLGAAVTLSPPWCQAWWYMEDFPENADGIWNLPSSVHLPGDGSLQLRQKYVLLICMCFPLAVSWPNPFRISQYPTV